MKVIYLTGFMGAGKTTIGRLLGKSLNLPVVDTDKYIEQQTGKTIPEIFNVDGEVTFREYEKKCIQELPTENIIITTGGGMVTQLANRQWMKQNGFTIFLHAEIEEVFKRVAVNKNRPLFDKNDQEKMTKLYHDRLPFYEEADLTVKTTSKSIEMIVKEIINTVKK
ncbi:shikimate kinase [Bacillus timonensis]|nr:shikimate kinase [Bacillus timonensis]